MRVFEAAHVAALVSVPFDGASINEPTSARVACSVVSRNFRVLCEPSAHAPVPIQVST